MKPHQLASVEAAGKAALAGATAALKRALSPGGMNGGGTTGTGPLSDRVASLVGRLEESARTTMVEERSEFTRSSAAFMMKLATEASTTIYIDLYSIYIDLYMY